MTGALSLTVAYAKGIPSLASLNERVRLAVTTRDPGVMRVLTRDPEWCVREILARKGDFRSCPAADSDWHVRDALAMNRSVRHCPEAIALLQEDSLVRYAVELNLMGYGDI